VSLAFAQADVAALAVAGRGPFAAAGPNETLRALLALFRSSCMSSSAPGTRPAAWRIAGRRVAAGWPVREAG